MRVSCRGSVTSTGASVRECVAVLRVGDGGLPAVGGLDDRLLFAGVVAASKAEDAVPVNRGCSLTGDARESLTGVTGRYPAFKEVDLLTPPGWSWENAFSYREMTPADPLERAPLA